MHAFWGSAAGYRKQRRKLRQQHALPLHCPYGCNWGFIGMFPGQQVFIYVQSAEQKISCMFNRFLGQMGILHVQKRSSRPLACSTGFFFALSRLSLSIFPLSAFLCLRLSGRGGAVRGSWGHSLCTPRHITTPVLAPTAQSAQLMEFLWCTSRAHCC